CSLCAVVGTRGRRSRSGAPLLVSAIRYGQALTPLGTAPLDDVAATWCRHARAEPVRRGTLPAVGLIRPLHGVSFQSLTVGWMCPRHAASFRARGASSTPRDP